MVCACAMLYMHVRVVTRHMHVMNLILILCSSYRFNNFDSISLHARLKLLMSLMLMYIILMSQYYLLVYHQCFSVAIYYSVVVPFG